MREGANGCSGRSGRDQPGFFGDRDQPVAAKVYAFGRDLPLPWTCANLAKAVRPVATEAEAVILGSGMESEPAMLEAVMEVRSWVIH